MTRAERGPDGSVEIQAYVNELAEAYRPIAETEQAADQWLAAALRRLARDPQVIVTVYNQVFDPKGHRIHGDTIRGVLNTVASFLEEGD